MEPPEPEHNTTGPEEEISKKEVLREMSITYGQFYRWKRMGLLPESWFRHRATVTGQETFLPREKVLRRIRQIQELKGDYSLDRIARILSPDLVRRVYTPQELEGLDWAAPAARDLLPGAPEKTTLGFLDLVCLAMVSRLLAQGRLSREEIRQAARTLTAHFEQIAASGGGCHLVVVRRGRESLAVLHSGSCAFGDNAELIADQDITRLIEEVKLQLQSRID